MNARKITMYICDECGEIYKYKQVANYCCSKQEKEKYDNPI